MIKTWQQRCEEHPDHEGIVSEQMICDRMQEEIDELRKALAHEALDRMVAENQRLGLYDDAMDKQEPVDWEAVAADQAMTIAMMKIENKKEWVGLTKDEVDSWELPDCPTVFEFAQFIEAELKEKNG